MDSSAENRLEYLESRCETLSVENRVLAAAVRGLLRALPSEVAEEAVETVRQEFEEAAGKMQYEENPHADLFCDVVHEFFGENN